MLPFAIGQKVKLLHSRDEGEVVQAYPDGRLLVRLDDQLEIEIPANEIVAMDPAPAVATQRLSGAKTQHAFVPNAYAPLVRAVYLVIDRPQETRVDLYLLNHSITPILYSVCKRENLMAKGLLYGQLPKDELQVVLSTTLENLVQYSDLVFQWMCFSMEKFDAVAPVQANFKLRNKHLMLPAEYNSVLGRDTIFINLTLQENTRSVAEALRSPARRMEARGDARSGMDSLLKSQDQAQEIVDLHIEKLVENPSRFTKREMMDIQLERFDQMLDRAVAQGLREATFIHGVGNGFLKNEIHRRLERHKQVKSFALDSFERFGFGATRLLL